MTSIWRVTLVAFLGFNSVVALSADEPWFKLVEARDGGYLAGGKLHGSSWAFRIPGRVVKSMGNSSGGQPMFTVDDVFLSVTAVNPESFGRGTGDPLAAQRKYEQEYQRKTFPGVKLSEHDLCKGAKYPHGGWMAEIPPRADENTTNLSSYHRTPYQVYVSFQVADMVLMVNSAYGSEKERNAVVAKLDAICRSFIREKP